MNYVVSGKVIHRASGGGGWGGGRRVVRATLESLGGDRGSRLVHHPDRTRWSANTMEADHSRE